MLGEEVMYVVKKDGNIIDSLKMKEINYEKQAMFGHFYD